MEHSKLLAVLCLILSFTALTWAVDGSTDDTIFNYHSFQLATRAGRKECFYQLVAENTTLTIIWHVMSSTSAGELAVVVTLIKEPDMRILYQSTYAQMGDHKSEGLEKGTYEVCIDNESGYTTKIVYLWLDFQRMKSWEDELSHDSTVQEYQLKRDFVRDILRSIEARLHDMNYYQTIYKQNNLYDETVLLKLYNIVHQRSLLASLVILISGFVQVMFIKKLFSMPKNKANAGI